MTCLPVLNFQCYGSPFWPPHSTLVRFPFIKSHTPDKNPSKFSLHVCFSEEIGKRHPYPNPSCSGLGERPQKDDPISWHPSDDPWPLGVCSFQRLYHLSLDARMVGLGAASARRVLPPLLVPAWGIPKNCSAKVQSDAFCLVFLFTVPLKSFSNQTSIN